MSKTELDIVNNWIDENYNPEIEEKINFKNCYDILMQKQSTRKNIDSARKAYIDSLSNSELSDTEINKCCDAFICKYIDKLISVGTKGVIRGNKFRDCVYQAIDNILMKRTDYKEFIIKKEPHCYKGETRPDISISKNNVIIELFIQLDFFKGGHQAERGKSYVKDKNKICVICSKPPKFKTKTKVFDIFNTGIYNKNLYYITNINECISLHFGKL
jgi:ribosomal protein L36